MSLQCLEMHETEVTHHGYSPKTSYTTPHITTSALQSRLLSIICYLKLCISVSAAVDIVAVISNKAKTPIGTLATKVYNIARTVSIETQEHRATHPHSPTAK